MFIPVKDASIFATAFGPVDAPVIVGLGGWIGNWELWQEPFSRMSAAWRAIAFDHRGCGLTLAPLESIQYSTLVEDVCAVLDAYQVQQCILAAESAGARIALGAALRFPDRITGLVIVDGSYAYSRVEPNDPFLAALRTSYPQTIHNFVEACVPEPDSEQIKMWGRKLLLRAEPQAAEALYGLSGAVDLREQLPEIQQPTLILHGEADVIVPIASSEKLAAALPDAKLVRLPGIGHVPTMTCPERVVEEINAFFCR